MAYFSNGSEGEALDQQCSECIHANPDKLCPVFAVQMTFNYDQLKEGNEGLKSALSILVGDDGLCRMKPLIDSIGVVNVNRKCLQRPLVFGDEEQINAIHGR